jgi:hypothetical protein
MTMRESFLIVGIIVSNVIATPIAGRNGRCATSEIPKPDVVLISCQRELRVTIPPASSSSTLA